MDESYLKYYDMINQQQQANNAWSAEQAQKAMEYQTEMSNTAHQREVADLKAAGLNPVLSAGGQGATTGSGHAATAGNENVTALYGLLSKTIDAQIKEAEAMKTTAKAVSGSSGSYNPSSVVDQKPSGYAAAYGVLRDMAKRKYGISYEAFDRAASALGLDPASMSDKDFNKILSFYNSSNSNFDLNSGKTTSKKRPDYNAMAKDNANRMKWFWYNLFDPGHKVFKGSVFRSGNGFAGSTGSF